MMNKKKYLTPACVCAAMAMVSCGGNDDVKKECDPATYETTCLDASHMTQCSAHGMIQLKQCTMGCVSGACAEPKDACDPADYPKCVESSYLTCVDAQIVTETCGESQICSIAQNGCIEQSAKCTDEEKACIDGAPAVCENGAWSKKAACETGQTCENGECKGGAEPAVCKDEEKKCIDGVPAICQNNTWEKTTACGADEQCVGGTCQKYIACDPACDSKTQTCDTATGTCKDRSKQYETETIETLPPASGDHVCERTGEGDTLVIRGDVLTKDKVYLGGGVVVSNGKITKVGAITEADMAQATVLTCPDAVISAGLINAHDHITYTNARPGDWDVERFNHRHEWRKGKNGHAKIDAPSTSTNETGELRMLLSGTTSVFGSGSVTGLTRNIDKEDAVPGHKYAAYNTFPLGDSGGSMYDSGCSKYKYSLKSGTHAPHIGEGISESALNELRCLSGEGEGAKNIFDSNLAIIHGVAATPGIVSVMAENDTKLIWSPRTNISLYGDTARIPLYYSMGVTIALGTDWIYSGSMNMLRELQCADFLNSYYFDYTLTDYDLWMAATYNGALALGYADVLGNLAPGYVADIAVYKKDGKTLHRAVIDAKIQDVAAVILDGKIVYGDANVITETENTETFDMCETQKKIRTKETGTSMTYAQIKAADKYAPFFCGTPTGEPTCVPMRQREADTSKQYTPAYGAASYDAGAFISDSNDIDGDGIPNDADNCPTIFNPVRIQYGPTASSSLQADADGDGMGDECDPYPFCATNDSTCKAYNAKDVDGDGILNDADNCPNVANPDQKDTDGDGIGDACDKCPNEAGIAALDGCPLAETTIKSLRDMMVAGTVADNTPVMTTGVVSGLGLKYDTLARQGFFMQQGTEAGIYVYGSQSASTVEVGDIVKVSGTLTVYNGLLEIKDATATKTGTDTVSARSITATESVVNPNPYDSMLVTVNGVTTTAETPTFATAATSVWTANDAAGNPVYIDDFAAGSAVMRTAIAPSTYYASITGILVYDFSQSKIAPRSAADIVSRPSLASIASAVPQADFGETVMMTVSLNKAAESDMPITMNCGTATCSNATVAAGSATATVNVTMPSEAGTVTVTATDPNNNSASATIECVDPAVPVSVAEIASDKKTINPGSQITLTVNLNKYAKAATTVALTTDNSEFTLTPASISIGEMEKSGTAVLTAPATANDGTKVKVTAKTEASAGTETEEKSIEIEVKKASDKYVETFEGIKSSNADSYLDFNFESTAVPGVTWTIAKGRTDTAEYSIDGAGLMFNQASKKGGTISAEVTTGVGSISVQAKQAYTSEKARTVSITIGEASEPCGSVSIVADTNEVYTAECENVNQSGNVKITVTSKGAQTVVDNIAWTAF